MKRWNILLFAVSLSFLSLTLIEKTMGGILPNKEMVQVGIVVADVEKSAEAWASFLGLETVPQIKIATGDDKNPTHYKGKPSNAQAKLAFFKLDNMMVELIEPLGGPSTWQSFLDKTGGGIHHIAFQVKGMKSHIKVFEANNIHLEQHGGWKTGEYAYMDASKELGLIIELLENYNQK